MDKEFKLFLKGPEEWERTRSEIKELEHQAWQKCVERLGEIEAALWFEDEKMEFIEKVKREIPEPNKYIAWHAFGGSSMDFKNAPKLDLPEPYSVKSFYLRILNHVEK